MPGFSLSSVDGLLFDLDGVLFVGDRPIDGAQETLDGLRKHGVPCRFLTNTTTRSFDSLYEKIQGLGLNIGKGEVFSPPRIAARYLRKMGAPRCLLVLEEDTAKEFAEFPQDDKHPEVIVIGHYGNRWTYDLLNRLFKLVMDGAEIVALHKGRFWQTDEGLTLDIGAFVAGLEHATGKKATVIGKPSPTFFRLALEDMGVEPERAAMIGDDIVNDIKGAQDAGMTGILVKTGKYRPDYVAKSDVKPDFIFDSVADLQKYL